MNDRKNKNEAIMNIITNNESAGRIPPQMTIAQFKKIYSNKWRINGICYKCQTIISRPLKNFIDCFLGMGVEGDEELTKACEEYQRVEQKIWELLNEHDFEFIEDKF